MSLSGQLLTRQRSADYLNFYGNLMKASTPTWSQVLDALQTTGACSTTRWSSGPPTTARWALAHGGMRQKNFNAYEETTARPARLQRGRLRAIPGTTVALSLAASTKQVTRSGDAFTDEGKVTGAPVGTSAITLAWQLHPADGTGTVAITINGGAGSLKAVGKTSYVISGNDITLTGTADLVGGTGAFRGLRGKGLAFRESNLNGKNGQITMRRRRRPCAPTRRRTAAP